MALKAVIPQSRLKHDDRAEDAELVRSAARGDHSAFAIVMRRHNRMLYRVARSILKVEAEAEDALQDAYLAAYRNLAKFRGDAKLSTWLTRIVINEALSRMRKRNPDDAVVQIDERRSGDPFAYNDTSINNSMESPENATHRAQMRQLLECKIDELPVAFRTVFVMREIEDMTVEETASCLSIPAATVRTRLFRAKSLLREALAREIDFAQGDAFDFAGERCDRIVAHVLARLARAG